MVSRPEKGLDNNTVQVFLVSPTWDETGMKCQSLIECIINPWPALQIQLLMLTLGAFMFVLLFVRLLTVRAAFRSNNFIIGLTDVSPAVKSPQLWNYDVCGQWPGAVGAGATVHLRCWHIPETHCRCILTQAQHSRQFTCPAKGQVHDVYRL